MSTQLHNMSAPPRTEVRVEKRAIANRIVAFSLAYALIAVGLLESSAALNTCSEKEKLLNAVLENSSSINAAIRARWRSPRDLFAKIGTPKTLPIAAYFLIGWRVGLITAPIQYFFCADPQLVAGVQARCFGELYLSYRSPDLRWERLLSPPIAFDEPNISALFA